jgi:hypothetical protein
MGLQGPPPSPAGYSVTASSGGTWVSDGLNGEHAEGPYGGLNPRGAGPATGGEGGNPSYPAGPGSASCSGQISMTLTWSGGSQNLPAPPVAIVKQTSTASWSGDSGSCSNGLGDEPVEVEDGEYVTGTLYSTVNGPGNTINRSCSPAASAALGLNSPTSLAAGACSVNYSVAAYPVRLMTGSPKTDHP